jgi:hypothetical protein
MSCSTIHVAQLPASLLPNTFNLIRRNGCFVGVNCSMNTARLSFTRIEINSVQERLSPLIYHAESFEQLNDLRIPIDFSQLTRSSTILQGNTRIDRADRRRTMCTLSSMLKFKPAKQRNRAISTWPCRAAMCNGVASALFLTSMRQPNELSASTTGKRPSRLA